MIFIYVGHKNFIMDTMNTIDRRITATNMGSCYTTSLKK